MVRFQDESKAQTGFTMIRDIKAGPSEEVNGALGIQFTFCQDLREVSLIENGETKPAGIESAITTAMVVKAPVGWRVLETRTGDLTPC